MRLLVPHDYLENQINETTPLSRYLPIKAKYGVSVRALITHAKKTNLITPARERSLYIQMSSQGWNKKEPVEVACEEPMLFAQAAKRLWPSNTTAEMSTRLGLPRDLAAMWLGSYRAPTTNAKVVSLADYKARSQRPSA